MDANLFVNQHIIKICFTDSYGGTDDAISLNYTIDYPRVDLNPLDTKRFKLYYSDNKINAKYDFNKCIEMEALTRESRDLIALSLKCFSAHTYYINSKIISTIPDKDEKTGHAKKPETTETTVSSLLLELEFVKRELYN